MSQNSTWNVVSWDSRPVDAPDGIGVELCCDCGYEATCPTSGIQSFTVIARLSDGRSLVLDPPNAEPPIGWMPDAIKCRSCGRIYNAGAGKQRGG